MQTILEQEIARQPAAIAHWLEVGLPHAAEIVAQLPAFDHILVAARGSSAHAGLYGASVWGGLGGYPVSFAHPSLYTQYQTPPRLKHTLVIGISQSGQSPDILAVIDDAVRQGMPTLAITNDAQSPLATHAAHVLDMAIGPERSIAATRTYSVQLAIMAALAALWSGDAARLTALQQVPDALERLLTALKDVTVPDALLTGDAAWTMLGRGVNLSTANEIALKCKELARVAAMGISTAEFRHGPIAAIDEGAPVLLIAPSGPTFEDTSALGADLVARGAALAVITDVPDAFADAAVHLPLGTDLPEWLSPLSAVLPGQLLALRLTQARGLDPDQPFGLVKVVRTR